MIFVLETNQMCSLRVKCFYLHVLFTFLLLEKNSLNISFLLNLLQARPCSDIVKQNYKLIKVFKICFTEIFLKKYKM